MAATASARGHRTTGHQRAATEGQGSHVLDSGSHVLDGGAQAPRRGRREHDGQRQPWVRSTPKPVHLGRAYPVAVTRQARPGNSGGMSERIREAVPWWGGGCHPVPWTGGEFPHLETTVSHRRYGAGINRANCAVGGAVTAGIGNWPNWPVGKPTANKARATPSQAGERGPNAPGGGSNETSGF